MSTDTFRKWDRGRSFGLLFLVFSLILLVVTARSAPLAAQSTPKTNPGDKITMDFDQVDIRVFIKFISEITGKNFIIDDRVRGKKVTVISPQGISVTEAYTVFESVLEVYGFSTVPSGEVTKIVRSVEARRKSLPVDTSSGAAFQQDDEFVTQIIPLENADVQEVRKILVPMVSKEGLVVHYAPTNLLILIDFRSNINRLLKIVRAVDVPGEDAQINVFELNNSQAAIVAKELLQILAPLQKKDQKQGEQTPLAIIPYERLNLLITLSNQAFVEKINKLILSMDKPTPKGKGNIHVVSLNNAVAEDLAQVLSGLAGARVSDKKQKEEEIISKEARIVADKATNSLVITATPEEFSVIENIINELDKSRKQVYVEAAIIEVSTDSSFDFGVDWQLAGETGDSVFLSKLNSPPYGQDFDIKNMGQSFLSQTAAQSNPLSIGLLSFPFLYDINNDGNEEQFFGLGSFLTASRDNNLVNIISTPQLMTLENEEASVVVAENRPFQTSVSVGGTNTRDYQNFEYKDVGVTLKLTPQINDQGFVKLKVYQEVSRVDPNIQQETLTPITRKRTAETTVEVQNGKTMVIAGLIEESNSDGETGVPGLSRIPLLGNLFKETSKSKDKKNLMVFITPHVVRTPDDVKNIYFNKKKHLENIRFDIEGMTKPMAKDTITAPLIGMQ